MATDETKLPAIPPIPSNADPQLKTYLAAVDEALKVRLGRTGDPKDRAVTVRELIDAGIAENFLENPFNPNAGTPENTFIPTNTIELTIPPDVTGFSGAGAFQKIILSWDLAQFPNFAFTEIWRHTSNSIGDATRIDTTRAQVYADTVDVGANFYYWVRHVSTSNIVGQFTNGINVTTSKISNSNVSDFITTGALTAAQIQAGSLTSASGVFGQISANDITAGTLNATNVSVSNLDIGGSAIDGSIGRIGGTAGNEVNMFAWDEVTQTNFADTGPHHIAKTTVTDSLNTVGDVQVLAGYVMGGYRVIATGQVVAGAPLFSHAFTTFNWGSGTKKHIVSVFLDPIGTYGSASGTGFSFAMKQTTNASAYTGTSTSDYLTTVGTTKGGRVATQNYLLSDIVDLQPNATYYIWVFGVMDDVGQNSQGTRGIRDGQIQILGLNDQ